MKRLILMILFVINHIIICAVTTDGIIYDVVGATKSTEKYNGCDLWVWDGKSSSFTVNAYTTKTKNVYEGCIPGFESEYCGQITAYYKLYYNATSAGQATSSKGSTYQGITYPYKQSMSINKTVLTKTYNEICFKLSGENGIAFQTPPIYICMQLSQYTISTSATNGTVSGAGTYDYNTSVTLKATPKEHYHFVKWSDGNTSNPRTITVTKDATYTAIFALDQFTINATSEHGSVIGSGTYNYGTTATLTATNSDCYSFQKWSDGNTDNPRQVVITQDSIFLAIFVWTGYQETIKCTMVNESSYGSVTFIGEVIKDSEIALKATAPESSQFIKWSDNNTSNPRSVTITQDSTFTAIFEKINFTITFDANQD